jgi:hypothetical protein
MPEMLLRLDAILQQAFPMNSRNYVSLIAESFYARLIMDRRCSFLDCAKASVVTPVANMIPDPFQEL